MGILPVEVGLKVDAGSCKDRQLNLDRHRWALIGFDRLHLGVM